jgi:hypothetical protein
VADSNDTSNAGPPYKETRRVGEMLIEGEVHVDMDGAISIRRDSGLERFLADDLAEFGLPRRLHFAIRGVDTGSTRSTQ